MPCSRDAYINLSRQLMAKPASVSVMPDSHLVKLSRHAPADPALHAPIAAELWVRRWLYAGDTTPDITSAALSITPAGLSATLKRECLPGREGNDICQHLHQMRTETNLGLRICACLTARLHDFMCGQGVVAVLAGHDGEAVPVPFTILRPAPAGMVIRDKDHVMVPGWAEHAEALRETVVEDLEIVLQCSLGACVDRVAGHSFMLPIALAHARLVGCTADYPAYAVLATGGLLNHRVQTVDGLEAKARLAANLKAVFIAPDHDMRDDRSLALNAEEHYPAALDRISLHLQDCGITSLAPKDAKQRIDNLWRAVSSGSLELAEAARKLMQYEHVLADAPEGIWSDEGRLRALLLRGAIANHCGCPDDGNTYLVQAAELAEHHPVAYAQAISHRVVSLTDLGDYDGAEAIGRDLCGWVDDSFSGSPTDRAHCRMIARGTLGGQPLLFKALLGHDTAEESRQLLLETLEIARDLGSEEDICRDVVQVALWHALFDSSSYVDECINAQEQLAKHGRHATVSEGYLNRTRFLGAYRAWRQNGVVQDLLDSWPLPSDRVGHMGWVRATSLKYRGALLAAAGRTAEARHDFDEALSLLADETSPLLRFVRGTVALQAAESLGLDAETSAWLDQAVAIFTAFSEWFSGDIAGQQWLERAQGLQQQVSTESLPDPQRYFPY